MHNFDLCNRCTSSWIKSPTHGHSHPGQLLVRLSQCALHGAIRKEYMKTSVMCVSDGIHFPMRAAYLFLGTIQGTGVDF